MMLIEREVVKPNLQEFRHPNIPNSRHVLDQVLEKLQTENSERKNETLRSEHDQILRVWCESIKYKKQRQKKRKKSVRVA